MYIIKLELPHKTLYFHDKYSKGNHKKTFAKMFVVKEDAEKIAAIIRPFEAATVTVEAA